MTHKHLALAIGIAIALCSGIAAHAMGEEEFGNKPLSDANYKDWPGIMDTINDTNRVYRVWVNGNEFFNFKGDTPALNNALRRFGAAGPKAEIVLRPGPGVTHSFDGTRKVEFNWELHLVGGIAKHMTTLDRGASVWNPNPVLSVYVDGSIDLQKMELPKGVTVRTLAEVKKTNMEGLQSKDQTVRGWTCGNLGGLDPYDPAITEAITKMLSDPVDWVKLNAASVLGARGAAARAALPRLRELTTAADKQLSAEATKAVASIDQAPNKQAEARAFAASCVRIDKVVAAYRKAG